LRPVVSSLPAACSRSCAPWPTYSRALGPVAARSLYVAQWPIMRVVRDAPLEPRPATWAWAGKCSYRLGRIQFGSLLAIDSDRTTGSGSRGIKNPRRRLLPRNPNHFFSLLSTSVPCPGERAAAATLAMCASEGDRCRGKPGCLTSSSFSTPSPSLSAKRSTATAADGRR
jgi:hypothetical protein